MATWFGPNFPFFKGNTVLGSASQVVSRQEDNRLIRNDFIQGILTNKGERAFRPGFGGDVTRFLFDQNDDSSRNSLSSSIRQQAGAFHPRIIINSIDVVQPDNKPNTVVVKIFGRTTLDAADVNDLLVNFMVPTSGTLRQEPLNPLGT